MKARKTSKQTYCANHQLQSPYHRFFPLVLHAQPAKFGLFVQGICLVLPHFAINCCSTLQSSGVAAPCNQAAQQSWISLIRTLDKHSNLKVNLASKPISIISSRHVSFITIGKKAGFLAWDAVKLTLKVGFICPFVVDDPTDLATPGTATNRQKGTR